MAALSINLDFLKCSTQLNEFTLVIVDAPGFPSGEANAPYIILDILPNVVTSTSTLQMIKLEIHYRKHCQMLQEFFADDVAPELPRLEYHLSRLPQLKKFALGAIGPCIHENPFIDTDAAPDAAVGVPTMYADAERESEVLGGFVDDDQLREWVCDCKPELWEYPNAMDLGARLFPDLHKRNLLTVEGVSYEDQP